jgi:hypothetical protein
VAYNHGMNERPDAELSPRPPSLHCAVLFAACSLTFGLVLVPHYVRQRQLQHQKECVTNLKRISSATEQWAMDNRKSALAAPPPIPVLAARYLDGKLPRCPSGGTYLQSPTVQKHPKCTFAAPATVAHKINCLCDAGEW